MLDPRPIPDASIFRDRRRRFVGALPPGSLALCRAAPVSIRSNDVEFLYRQDSDLYYLTGFPEPETIALLDTGGGEPFTLFVRPRDPERETWTGPRYGIEGARESFGADAAHTVDRFDEVFGKLLDARGHLYFSLGREDAFNQKILEHVRRSQATRARSGAPALVLSPPSEILHEMRLRKGAEELERMRRAAEITAVAHREAVAAARPGAGEHEVEAAIDYAFRRLGAMGPAYPSIVASGVNATVLHYVDNCRRMEDGDLLLVDAGSEYDYYCSDVTRTFPVRGRFRAEQRAVYDVVLRAQKSGIAKVAPGVTIEDVHREAVRVLVEGLCELGVLSHPVEEAIRTEAYRPYYMHRTSHWLGMDVHDVGRYRDGDAPRRLEPGMVLTVEPGLYFAPRATDTRFTGIGVRIEDDVLVTSEGHEILTRAIPKEPDELEALRK